MVDELERRIKRIEKVRRIKERETLSDVVYRNMSESEILNILIGSELLDTKSFRYMVLRKKARQMFLEFQIKKD